MQLTHMSKLIATVLVCWALGMLGLLITNMGYVVPGKVLSYVFGIMGIIAIFSGVIVLIRNQILKSRRSNMNRSGEQD